MSEVKEEGPKLTSNGLPVVSVETVEAIWGTYTGPEKWGEHLEEVKGRLIKENPNLIRFIETQVRKYPRQMHNPMFEIFVATIAIFEHQAEANRLSSIHGF